MERSDQSDMRADAIVVAYRSAEIVGSCVASLRSDPAIDKIVVVNNSPGDGTEAATRSAGVVYLASPRNLGFGPAINFARSEIRAPYVIIANDDTTQRHDTTSALVDCMRRHARCALIGPRVVNSTTGDLERTSQYDLTLMRMAVQALGWPEALKLTRTEEEHSAGHSTECIIAAFVLCRVEALDEIGWFDESIFLFGEDQDVCRRLRRAGWDVRYEPVGCVRHFDGYYWKQLSDQGRARFREARQRELRKAAGERQARAYTQLVGLRDRLRRSGGSGDAQ